MLKGTSKWHVPYLCPQVARNTLTQISLEEIKESVIFKYYNLAKIYFVFFVPMVCEKVNMTFGIGGENAFQ